MLNRKTGIRSFIAGTLGMALLLSLMPISSSAQLGRRVWDEAVNHFRSSRFEDAIPLFREHLGDRPKDGKAWYYLGYSLLAEDQNAEAIPCFVKAIQNKYAVMNCQYDIACAYAKLGDDARALRELERAIDFGYNATGQLSRDPDLESIRDTDEFRRLLARTRNPVEHYEGGRALTNLRGVWVVANEDGTIGDATGTVFVRGFSQQLSLDFEGRRYLHLSLLFSASENTWYAAGGDTDGTAYTGRAEVSENRIKVDGKRADGGQARLTMVWSDEAHADMKIEDRLDGSWQERSTVLLTETASLEEVLSGGR